MASRLLSQPSRRPRRSKKFQWPSQRPLNTAPRRPKSPPRASVAGFACSSTFTSAHPSHGSWPHKELHQRLQWE
eukprot:2293363-Pyramimonas_sp.AAC.1